jgi:hypothetical protein
MPRFGCAARKTRLHGTESKADPIGDLCRVCGSLLAPVGDLGEIVWWRAIETRGGLSHSGASVPGQLIVGRLGEIIARRELRRARVRLESKAATLTLSAHKSKPLALALAARATTP